MVNSQLNILKIMKKEKVGWEKALQREKERKTLKEFFG